MCGEGAWPSASCSAQLRLHEGSDIASAHGGLAEWAQPGAAWCGRSATLDHGGLSSLQGAVRLVGFGTSALGTRCCCEHCLHVGIGLGASGGPLAVGSGSHGVGGGRVHWLTIAVGSVPRYGVKAHRGCLRERTSLPDSSRVPSPSWASSVTGTPHRRPSTTTMGTAGGGGCWVIASRMRVLITPRAQGVDRSTEARSLSQARSALPGA